MIKLPMEIIIPVNQFVRDTKLKYSDTPNINNMVVHKYALYAYDPDNHKINSLICDRPLKKRV